jgi:hypothetical protein
MTATPQPMLSPPSWRWLVVPAAITLAVTALRFTGELLLEQSTLFSRAAGGGGALVGIGWLIPVFGAWFALRLGPSRAPARPVGAWMTLLLGFLCMAGCFAVAALVLARTPFAMAVGALGSLLGGWSAFHAWRGLGFVLLGYAIAARVPVVVLTVVDVTMGLGTHYGRLAEGAADPGPLPRLLVLCLAQVVVWVPLTLAFGTMAGLVVVAVRRERRRASGPAGAPP